MTNLLSLWGLPPGRQRTDIVLPGSPERCLSRRALEDGRGRIWMLETLRPGQFERRERIGRALDGLSRAGLPVPAYLAGPDGRFVVEHDGRYLQLSPYVPGDPLPQPEFIEDGARGESLGAFLCRLREVSGTVREFDDEPPFVLEAYVNELLTLMAERRPDLHRDLIPVLPALAPLFEAWPGLTTALCHGDFHPLNVIWHGRAAVAVIDWEFAGIRPCLFDAANCLGCVGIEDPHALVRGLAPALLHTLRRGLCLDRDAFALLPELLLGLRFAWMSEWLRRKDEEMIGIEVHYMRLLANSLDTLLPAWQKLLGE
ncbi:aminoglycoside phosphotransferase [Pseudodesulfovibrio mercurii]|uniref:Aminoglycoside phosphotransferase n=1 Tax=Pseudodesulfovibrio mercurii TaxID=641491 RepID=F0JIY5_9BACT|nr:phosphotransferase [Pseudodesulfovibrio mercurii]EGB15884.1 aminoglycoside phosphotransferase [Pseudodesulfovibrio mercurii]